jgi:hypothetical protein
MGSDKLAIAVSVTIGGTVHRIAGGDVRELELQLTSFGMTGRVAFEVADNRGAGGRETDALLAEIGKPGLIEVELSITAIPTDQPIDGAPAPLVVKGLVRERSVGEHDTAATRGVAVLSRRYELELVDPPRLLWSQHHPVELVTNKSLRDVIAAHKGDRITVDDKWDAALAPVLPMIFLGLDPAHHRASFYDFMMWLVDTRNGVWAWDHRTNTVRLSAAKVDPADPIKPWRREVGDPRTSWPEVPRQTVWVRNSFTENPSTSKADITPSAVAGVRHDFLITTPIADEATTRLTRERGRVITRGPVTTLRYDRFPAQPYLPGDLVELAADHGWSAAFTAAGKPLRCIELHLSARAQGGRDTHLGPGAAYEVAVTTVLEPKEETYVALPRYAVPRYPLRAEGKIVSEIGEASELTWQVYTDEKTSIDGYKVAVPLWKDGDAPPQIAAPFDPGFTAGQLYLTAYKGSRVLLELELDRATIVRFLDWRPGARLPADGQGDGLLLGKSPTSSTALTHTYEDTKPVFRLLRTNDKDVELLEIKEGSLRLQVKPS